MAETTTWFKTSRSAIDAVEVLSSTEKTVTVREYWRNYSSGTPTVRDRKHYKLSNYDCFFPTWQEAHAHLLAEAEGKLLAARHNLEAAQSAYGNVKGMKPPKEPQP